MRVPVPGYDAVRSYRLFATPDDAVRITFAPTVNPTAAPPPAAPTPCRARAYQKLNCNGPDPFVKGGSSNGIGWTEEPKEVGRALTKMSSVYCNH